MSKRTINQRVKEIFDYLDENEKIIGDDFKNIGMTRRAGIKWIDLIIYIQNQKKVRKFLSGKRYVIEYEYPKKEID